MLSRRHAVRAGRVALHSARCQTRLCRAPHAMQESRRTARTKRRRAHLCSAHRAGRRPWLLWQAVRVAVLGRCGASDVSGGLRLGGVGGNFWAKQQLERASGHGAWLGSSAATAAFCRKPRKSTSTCVLRLVPWTENRWVVRCSSPMACLWDMHGRSGVWRVGLFGTPPEDAQTDARLEVLLHSVGGH